MGFALRHRLGVPGKARVRPCGPATQRTRNAAWRPQVAARRVVRHSTQAALPMLAAQPVLLALGA